MKFNHIETGRAGLKIRRDSNLITVRPRSPANFFSLFFAFFLCSPSENHNKSNVFHPSMGLGAAALFCNSLQEFAKVWTQFGHSLGTSEKFKPALTADLTLPENKLSLVLASGQCRAFSFWPMELLHPWSKHSSMKRWKKGALF
jgi:uncharacterized membrane protein YeiB